MITEDHKMSHDDLVKQACKWLEQAGCRIIFHELDTAAREIPDAIGWRYGWSVLIECKATRNDFLKDKKKFFRRNPDMGMGCWRFYMCPPELIQPEELPEGWGLLWCYPGQVRRIANVPKGNMMWGTPPFKTNKRSEIVMLLSALRRLKLRGYLDLIYEPLPE